MLRSLLLKDVFLRKKGFAGDFGLHSLASLCISAFAGGEQKKRRLGIPIFGSSRDVFSFFFLVH